MKKVEEINHSARMSRRAGDIISKDSDSSKSVNKVVAIAISTGGPKTLQTMLPLLPDNLNAPVVIVQHMPKGFTQALASRMNDICSIKVTEAKEGDILQKGCVYFSQGGKHLKLAKTVVGTMVKYTDEPNREGVKPCANYMFESLSECDYDEVVCVVMTGMGQDGTEGIGNLKKKKKTFCISQERTSCVVYGMPKAVADAGYSDVEGDIHEIARQIIKHVGVTKNGC